MGGLVRLWLPAYLSALAFGCKERERERGGDEVCVCVCVEEMVWHLLLSCCGYISSTRLIVRVCVFFFC